MKKGYQEILSRFEKQFPEEMNIFGIKEFLPRVTEQDLLELKLAGFLEVNVYDPDKHGDNLHKISKEGFSHLVGLRTYQMAKATRKLTDWIKILTGGLFLIGVVQVVFTILLYLK